MGKEQGTPVSGSIIDLPPTADLTDPRLPRAFKGWTEFSLNHAQQLSKIGIMQPGQVVSLAQELSSTISKAIGVGNERNDFSPISEKKLVQLSDIISGEGNRVIFMRHGEQSPPEWIFSLTDPALQKIRMMRNPFNRQDLLTNNGLVDVFITALALLHVQAATGKRTRIFSSENLRAKEAAYIISIVIPGSGLTTLEGLNCITYKNEVDQPPVTEEELLADLPSGIMPWNPQLVDKLCKTPKSGMSQSEVIINTIGGLVEYANRKNGNKLVIVVTHNQQVAEVLREVEKLEDSAVRFPELTMLITQNKKDLFVLEKGVLSERSSHQPKTERSMRKVLEVFGDGYEWYKIRREEYNTGQKIPFLISPQPFYLSREETQEVLSIGKDVISYMHAVDELYHTEAEVKNLLDRGKPDFFREDRKARYLFIRPDLIITNDGFSICEIETSPFGLALAELLNRSYRMAGFNTLVEDDTLARFIRNNTPSTGNIIFSHKTASYEGQLRFLADKIFSGEGRVWTAQQADFALGQQDNLYRGFYQYEYLNDLFMHSLINSTSDQTITVIPSFTPYLEEKAILALVWDKRWQPILTSRLGRGAFAHLRAVIPPTWIVGEEQYSVYDLPGGIKTSEELASLSNSKRKFVLKISGFGNGSSWGEGVSFLHEKSTVKAARLLSTAQRETNSLYIIQEFRKCQERPLLYDGEDGIKEMKARIRMTPYFSFVEGREEDLIAIKITGCENTNYIHGSTVSINTAVAVT